MINISKAANGYIVEDNENYEKYVFLTFDEAIVKIKEILTA